MTSTANVDDQSPEKRHLHMFAPFHGISKTRSLSVKKWSHPKLKIEDTGPISLKKEAIPQNNPITASNLIVNPAYSARQKQDAPPLNPLLTKNRSSAALVSRSSMSEIFTLKQKPPYTKIETEIKNAQKSSELDISQIVVNSTPFKPVTGNRLETSSFLKSSAFDFQKDPSWPLKVRQKSVEMKRQRGSQILLTRQTEEEEVQSQISQPNRSHSKSEIPANLFDNLLRRSSLMSQNTVVSARNLSPITTKRKPLDKYSGGLLSQRNVTSTRVHTEEASNRHRRIASESEEVNIESYQKRNNKIASLLKPVPVLQDSYKGALSLLINNKPQLMPLETTNNEKPVTFNQVNYYEKIRKYKKETITTNTKIYIELNDLKKLVFRKLLSKGTL